MEPGSLLRTARTATGVALRELGRRTHYAEFATGADAAAQRSFVRAVHLAQQSGSPDRLVHGLSFSAFSELARRSGHGRPTAAPTCRTEIG